MSADKSPAVRLHCDFLWAGTSPCWRTYVALETRNVREARRQARREGWTHTADGKDFCGIHTPVRKERR